MAGYCIRWGSIRARRLFAMCAVVVLFLGSEAAGQSTTIVTEEVSDQHLSWYLDTLATGDGATLQLAPETNAWPSLDSGGAACSMPNFVDPNISGVSRSFEGSHFQTCSCIGARQSTVECNCRRPDGSTFTRESICWQKKVLGENRYCGQFCESCFNVCNDTNRRRDCR